MMAEYEMKVRTYYVATGALCHEWYGSELFEAVTIEEALNEALESERAEHIENGHIYVNTSAPFHMIWTEREPGHGYVAWTCIDDDGKEVDMVESIEMIERECGA